MTKKCGIIKGANGHLEYYSGDDFFKELQEGSIFCFKTHSEGKLLRLDIFATAELIEALLASLNEIQRENLLKRLTQ